MNKLITLLGASAIALGVMSDGAEARKRSYEINGQRYSYETNDPQQVAVARKRIEAANAADAARAKAEAERASNPLVAVFGSPTQREAAQAQARLQQILAEPVPAAAAAGSDGDQQAAKAERRDRDEDRQTQEAAAPQPDGKADEKTNEQAAAQEREHPEKTAETAAPPPVAEPQNAQAAANATVKSVTFDIATGIKTTVLTDGSVQEEPFDSALLSKLVAMQGSANSLTTFVNKLRRAPSETTGSIPPGAIPAASAPAGGAVR